MTAGRRWSGFTLMELMLVVALLGAFATLAGTAVGAWVADARQQNAAYAVLKLAREAHDLAQRSGKARMFAFTQAASNGLGTFTVRAGMGPSCLKTPWAAAVAEKAYDLAAANPTAGVPAAGDSGRQVIRGEGLRNGVAYGTINLCVEPSGRTFSQVTGEPLVTQTTLISFQILRELNGAQTGMRRTVLFEPGGRARLQR